MELAEVERTIASGHCWHIVAEEEAEGNSFGQKVIAEKVGEDRTEEGTQERKEEGETVDLFPPISNAFHIGQGLCTWRRKGSTFWRPTGGC